MERISAQLISFIVSVVLARLLLPEDYGAISMVMVFITIADIFVSSGFGNALIQKKDADNVDFSSVFYFNIGFSTFLYLIIFICSPYIATFYNMPILSPVLKVMGVRIIIAAVNSVQQAFVSREMMFRCFFWSSLFGTLISGIFGVLMAYQGLGVWALVAQYMINTVVNTWVLWITVKWRPTKQFSAIRLKYLISFGWKILFEGLSSTIINQIRNLIIGKTYTSSDLGNYTRGQQLPNLLTINVSSAISAVLFPAMASQQDDRKRVKDLMRKSINISSYVLFPMLLGMAITAKSLVTLLFTEKWLGCVPYLQIFCYTQAAIIGMIPRHQALNSTGRSDIYMNEHLFARSTNIVILICVYKISVLAIALSGIVSSVILTATVMYTSKRYNEYGYKEQLSDVMPVLLLCVLMGVPVYLLQYLNLHYIITLLLQVIIGIAIYWGLSVWFKPEGYLAVCSYAKLMVNKFRTVRKTNV